MTRKLNRNYSLSAQAKGPLNIFDGGPRFGSTKLATAVSRVALVLATLSALLLIAARPAQAAPENVLYNFCTQLNCSDGAYPESSLTFDAAGNLYGTTSAGGLGYGTVFELTPNGNGGWNETVLYSFTGGADGATPAHSAVIFDSVGNLYGTAYSGGANGYGVVFELSPAGASWTETVLYSFANTPDGANPVNSLIMDPAGNLFGRTLYGGGGNGIVFELSPSGGGWTEQVIYAAETEASNAGLTMDAAGNIFGTTYSTVFELSPNGNGGWNPNVIHTFCSGKDGCDAEGTLALDQAGDLYGTTVNGGNYSYGTVYKLGPGEQGWTEKLIHNFGNGAMGVWPFAGTVLDAAGNIYGTAVGAWPGGGVIYELAPIVGTSNYTEHVLWTFHGWDGSSYFGNVLLDRGDVFYGTTPNGGSTFWNPPHFAGYGAVFELKIATKTTLTSSPNPSTYGQAVTFTATVTSRLGAPPDGETVSFIKGTKVLGTGALSGGSASFTTSALPGGTNPINPAYGGDSKFGGSTSYGVKQVVNKYTTTTTLNSSLNPSNYGQAVTLTATVTQTGPYQPTGTVIFKNGSATLGVGTLNAGGVATLTTAKIPVGANTLTAIYNGDALNAKSVSAAITQTVSQAFLSMVLTSTPNPSTFGKSVKFTATLTSDGGLPSGQPVTFSYNNATLGTANVNGKGVATFFTTTLPQGSDVVTAAYAGSVDYSSASATVTQVVN